MKHLISILILFCYFNLSSCSDSKSAGNALFKLQLNESKTSEREAFVEVLTKRLEDFLGEQYQINLNENDIMVEIPSTSYSKKVKMLFRDNVNISFCKIYEPPRLNQEELKLLDLIVDSEFKYQDSKDFYKSSNKRNLWVNAEEDKHFRETFLQYNVLFRPYVKKMNNSNVQGEIYFIKEGDKKSCFDSKPIAQKKDEKNSPENYINFLLGKTDSQGWAAFTTKNVNNSLAILVNGELVGTLLIQSPDRDGRISVELEDTDYIKFISASLNTSPINSNIIKSIQLDFEKDNNGKLEKISKDEIAKYNQLQEAIRYQYTAILSILENDPEFSNEFNTTLKNDFIKIANQDVYEYWINKNYNLSQFQSFLSSGTLLIELLNQN